MSELWCRLKKDPVTGQNTGIGFCEFRDKQTAEAARRMNNKKTIKGRLLRIDNPDGGRKGVVAVVCLLVTSITVDCR